VLSQAKAGERIEADKEVGEGDWEEPPIDPEMLRAYVSIAKNVIPELTDDAMNTIRDEYVEIRQSNDEDGPVPTTARTVTGLVRLSEASARMRLGERVTTDDVDRAVDILTTSMESLGVDPETGDLDAARMETGVGATKRDRRKGIKTVIRAKKPSSSEPAKQSEVEEAALELMDEDEYEHELQKLKDRGEVYQPGGPGTLDVT
jgi:replicative DNA helicase Mcm